MPTVLLLANCNAKEELKDIVVTKYQEVPMGYQFSNDIIEFDGKKFKPVLREEYHDKKLVAIEVFKSEGSLRYSIEDLKTDTLFAKSLPIVYERSVSTGLSIKIVRLTGKD